MLASRPLRERRAQNYVPGHLQSGSDNQGGSYAAMGHIDLESQTLHIVGTTYGRWFNHDDDTTASTGPDDPACFYGIVQLPRDDSTLTDWSHLQMLGRPNTVEQCHGLFLDAPNRRAYILGNSENPSSSLLGSLFNNRVEGAEEVVQIGMILDTTFEGSDLATAQNPLSLVGGRVEQGYDVNYPVAATGLSGKDARLYVVTMLTDDKKQNAAFAEVSEPNPTVDFKFGSDYIMYLQEYLKTDISDGSGIVDPNDGGRDGPVLKESLSPGESGEYATDGFEPIFVAGMVQLSDRLIVAGSTQGVGKGFTGQGADAFNMDGFITQFQLDNLQPLANNPTYRVSSGQDDFVLGICVADQSLGHVYVTGYTNGNLNGDGDGSNPEATRGFAMKLRLIDLQTIWIQEFEATPATDGNAVRAVSCAVTHDGNNVYVAGEVDGGAKMNLDDTDHTPPGGTDVWVAQLSSRTGASTDGDVVFLKQMGSDKNDFVAYRGGVQADKNGNAVLLGNTLGQVYRSRSSLDDGQLANVFVATFQKDTGDFTLPLDHEDFVTLPPRATLPPSPPTPAPVPAPPTSPSQDDDDDSGGGWIFLTMLLVIGIVGVIAGICYWNLYRIPKREIATDRSRVLDYLHDFDVEDVDLKHSATGGWHCSYAGDLAAGVNRQTNEVVFSSPGYRDNVNGQSKDDPLTQGRRAPTSSQSKEGANYTDNVFDIEDDDEDNVAFGSARSARRERKEASNYDGLLNAYQDVPVGEGSSRRDKAKERWQNREII